MDLDDARCLEADIRHGLRERLKQEIFRVLNQVEHAFLDASLVNGIFEPVGSPRLPKVAVDGKVDGHILFFGTLVFVDAHDASGANVSDYDPVHDFAPCFAP